MPATFTIERDDEFYVFLKSNLPQRFQIIAEPNASYYSEWMFLYKLYDGGELIQTFEGDFRTLEKGSLIRDAVSILELIENGNNSC